MASKNVSTFLFFECPDVNLRIFFLTWRIVLVKLNIGHARRSALESPRFNIHLCLKWLAFFSKYV